MLKITRISNYREFESCETIWNDLVSTSATRNVFLAFEWIDAYIRHFLKNGELLILKILDGNELVGIAPLMITRCRYFGLPVRVVSFIGTVISDRMDFIMDGNKQKGIGLVLDYLMDIEREWDFIDLHEIAEDTGTTEAIGIWLRHKKCINILGPTSKNFFISFNREGGFSPCQRFAKSFSEKYRRAKNKRPSSHRRFSL